MAVRLLDLVDTVDIALELLDDEEGLGLSVDAKNRLPTRAVLFRQLNIECGLENFLAYLVHQAIDSG